MKPNFLYINPDQMRADALGCYGHPVVKTPNRTSCATSGTIRPRKPARPSCWHDWCCVWRRPIVSIQPDIAEPSCMNHIASLPTDTLPCPAYQVTVEPDGRHGGLLLFADAPETEIPDPDDPKVHYYGPGLHRAGVIELHDGETLYLAPGAVVEGGICAQNAKPLYTPEPQLPGWASGTLMPPTMERPR